MGVDRLVYVIVQQCYRNSKDWMRNQFVANNNFIFDIIIVRLLANFIVLFIFYQFNFYYGNYLDFVFVDQNQITKLN